MVAVASLANFSVAAILKPAVGPNRPRGSFHSVIRISDEHGGTPVTLPPRHPGASPTRSSVRVDLGRERKSLRLKTASDFRYGLKKPQGVVTSESERI